MLKMSFRSHKNFYQVFEEVFSLKEFSPNCFFPRKFCIMIMCFFRQVASFERETMIFYFSFSQHSRNQYCGKPNQIALFRPRKICEYSILFTACNNKQQNIFKCTKSSNEKNIIIISVGKVRCTADRATEESSRAFFLGLWMHRAYFCTSSINKKKHVFFLEKKGGTQVTWFLEQRISYTLTALKKNSRNREKSSRVGNERIGSFCWKWSYALWEFFVFVQFTVRLLCARRCFDLLYFGPRAAPYLCIYFFLLVDVALWEREYNADVPWW